MKNKGFTLVELLAVIVIIALISVVGGVGITAVKKNINHNMWESTILLIENSAARYGEDFKYRLKDMCEIDGVTRYSCLSLSVQYLIDKGYIKTKEVNEANEKVLINNTLEFGDEGYYVNDTYVTVYLENDIVYAKYIG